MATNTCLTTYSATNTAITITLANLGAAGAAARESTIINNTSTKYLDAIVEGQIGLTTSATGLDYAVYIYGYASQDGALIQYPCTGTDAALTTTPTNLSLLKVLDCTGKSSTNLSVYVPSVATGFGGVLPPYWGIVVDNRTNGGLTNTASNHFFNYTGVVVTTI